MPQADPIQVPSNQAKRSPSKSPGPAEDQKFQTMIYRHVLIAASNESALLPKPCDEENRHCYYQVLITTMESGLKNGVNLLERLSFHGKIGNWNFRLIQTQKCDVKGLT